MKLNVQFYDAFYPSLEDLTSTEKGAVMSTLIELTERPDSSGLNVHRVGDAATKCWSARVNDDIRLIFFRDKRTVVPAYVDHHDAAYKWAEGRAFDVHPDTGAAQIVIVGERYEEIVKRVVRREEVDPMAVKPFGQLTDAELLEYGTPKMWLEPLRSATVDAFLVDIGDALPDEAREFLMAVALGETPPPPPQRTKNPFTHPDAKRRPQSLRAFVERSYIALLASQGRRIDPPTAERLGHHCPSTAVSWKSLDVWHIHKLRA